MSGEQQFLVTGEICIDVLVRQAYIKQELIKLSGLSFRAMKVLVDAYPNSVSNKQMVNLVWQQTTVSPETVTQRIALIRKALIEAGIDPKAYLSSTRHVGYRWLKPVVKTDQVRQQKRHGLMVVLTLLLLVLGVWLFLPSQVFEEKALTETPDVNSTAVVSVDDLANQASKYLRMHNAKSN